MDAASSSTGASSYADRRAMLRARRRQKKMEDGATPGDPHNDPPTDPPRVEKMPAPASRPPLTPLPGLLGPAQRVAPALSPVRGSDDAKENAQVAPAALASPKPAAEIRVMPQRLTSPTPSDQANSMMKKMRMTTPPSSTIGNATSTTNMFTATGTHGSLLGDDDFSVSKSGMRVPRLPTRPLTATTAAPSEQPSQPAAFAVPPSSYSATEDQMPPRLRSYQPPPLPQRQQPSPYQGSWRDLDNGSHSSMDKSDRSDSQESRPTSNVYPIEVPGVLRSAALSAATPPGYRPPDLRLQLDDRQVHHQSQQSQASEHQMMSAGVYQQSIPQHAQPYPPQSPYATPQGIAGFCPTQQEVNGRSYLVLEMIGRGGSSRVYRVVGMDRKVYAVKKVRVSKGDVESLNGYANEIQLLEKLRGKPHIVQLIDAEIRHASNTILMVLECGDTDLAKVLAEKRSESLSPLFMQLYWQQMLEAVHIIHEERIVHGDLKPANFVMVQGALKLIDFGIAKAIQSDDTTRIVRDAQIGTPNYMSPEAINSGQDAKYKLGRQSDIWSLGCILYQMTYGKTPFADLPIMAKMKTIGDPSHKIDYPAAPCATEHLRKALQSCLQWDPSKRASIPDLLKSPFVELLRTPTAGTRKPPSQKHISANRARRGTFL